LTTDKNSISSSSQQLPKAQLSVSLPQKSSTSQISNGSKWSTDDHEQLKKLLLQFGYSRWKQIQRSAASIGIKLDNKPLP